MARLLIVDDDRDFASAIAKVLEDEGYEVDVELDVEGGVQSVRESPPDLLILDVMFPQDSTAGFEAARRIKGLGEHLEDMPILMLTAINQQFPLGFGSRDLDDHWLPVSDFVEKPVDFSVLKEKIARLLNKE